MSFQKFGSPSEPIEPEVTEDQRKTAASAVWTEQDAKELNEELKRDDAESNR